MKSLYKYIIASNNSNSFNSFNIKIKKKVLNLLQFFLR